MRTLALALLLLGACKHDDDPPFEVARSTQPRLTAVDPDDMQSAGRSILAFAVDLEKQLGAGPPANFIYAPYSIAEALMMTYAGMANATAAQLRAALHLELPDERAHAAMNGIDLTLRGYSNLADPSSFTLKVQDDLWAQKGQTLLPGFLDTMAQRYGAGVNLLDFHGDTEGSRQIINDWVAQQTEQHIKDLLPTGSINESTRLVLTNALYFKAGWASLFAEAATAPEPFHLVDGSTAIVPTMLQSSSYGVYQTSELTAIALPYKGEQVELVVILPNDLAAFEAGLSVAALEPVFAGVDGARRTVELHLPKLELRSASDLVRPLKALGVVDAFKEGLADLSKIDGGRDLFITGVVHQAWLKLDEDGTEAAAATAVVVGVDSSAQIPVDPTVVKIDRPFLFVVRDRTTGEPIFVGRVVDPR